MWLLLQLVDGSFPSGGFAHSSGLEAAVQIGGLSVIEDFFDDTITQAAHGPLPFVRAACASPVRAPELDALCDATLPMAVPNRASRAQGRALASAAKRIFELEVDAQHHAVVFGALFGALELSLDDAARAYLHGVARNVLSAGVRLGLVGPLEAQRIHASRASLLSSTLARIVPIDDVAQTAPLVEIHAALHHRLDARLFQS